MRLIALRGATTVDANDADHILTATEELMAEILERNKLDADSIVSCIFTLTPALDAEFPAVAARHMGRSRVPRPGSPELPAAAARHMGLRRVPLLCARETPGPGGLPRVTRVLIHCYPPVGVDPQH